MRAQLAQLQARLASRAQCSPAARRDLQGRRARPRQRGAERRRLRGAARDTVLHPADRPAGPRDHHGGARREGDEATSLERAGHARARQQRIATRDPERRKRSRRCASTSRAAHGSTRGRDGKQAVLGAVRASRHELDEDLDALESGAGARSRRRSAGPRALPRRPGPPRLGRLIWPVNGPITSPFCERRAWEAARPASTSASPSGTPIRAAGCRQRRDQARASGGYGNFTCVAHGGDAVDLLRAPVGDRDVSVGQTSARARSSASRAAPAARYGAHLHFEVRVNGARGQPAELPVAGARRQLPLASRRCSRRSNSLGCELKTFGVCFALGFLAAGAVLAAAAARARQASRLGLRDRLRGARRRPGRRSRATTCIQHSDELERRSRRHRCSAAPGWSGTAARRRRRSACCVGAGGAASSTLAAPRPLCVPLALGYAIGRIGCQLSGDGDYGKASDLPWAMAYPDGAVPTTGRRCIRRRSTRRWRWACWRWLLWRFRDRVRPGVLFAWYLVGAGTERLLVEFVRRNDAGARGLTAAQLESIATADRRRDLAGRSCGAAMARCARRRRHAPAHASSRRAERRPGCRGRAGSGRSGAARPSAGTPLRPRTHACGAEAPSRHNHAAMAATQQLTHVWPIGSRIDARRPPGGRRLRRDRAGARVRHARVRRRRGRPARPRAGVRRCVRAARHADSEVLFASKAFPCTAVYRVLAEEGHRLRRRVGRRAGARAARRLRPRADRPARQREVARPSWREALDAGVGTIVVDGATSSTGSSALAGARGARSAVLLRVTPDVRGDDPRRHLDRPGRLEVRRRARRRAGAAIERMRGIRRARARGLHMHIGSQLLDLDAVPRARSRRSPPLGDFPEINLGGGLGVAYTADQDVPSIEDYVAAKVGAVARAARARQADLLTSRAARWSPTPA